MLDLGAPELLVILVILLLIMGPSKLAGIGGGLGKSIREFRNALRPDDEPASTDQVAPAKQIPQEINAAQVPMPVDASSRALVTTETSSDYTSQAPS